MSEPTARKKVVFLSYAVETDTGHADQFCDQMRAHEEFIEVWRDSVALKPGTEGWTEALRDALAGADALVALGTKSWAKRQWCKEEWRHAEGKLRIPILTTPFGLERHVGAKVQVLRSRAGGPVARADDVEDEWRHIAERVADLVSPPGPPLGPRPATVAPTRAAAPPARPPAPAAPPSAARDRARRAILAKLDASVVPRLSYELFGTEDQGRDAVADALLKADWPAFDAIEALADAELGFSLLLELIGLCPELDCHRPTEAGPSPLAIPTADLPVLEAILAREDQRPAAIRVVGPDFDVDRMVEHPSVVHAAIRPRAPVLREAVDRALDARLGLSEQEIVTTLARATAVDSGHTLDAVRTRVAVELERAARGRGRDGVGRHPFTLVLRDNGLAVPEDGDHVWAVLCAATAGLPSLRRVRLPLAPPDADHARDQQIVGYVRRIGARAR